MWFSYHYLCLKEHEKVVTQQAKVSSEVLNSDALDWDSR